MRGTQREAYGEPQRADSTTTPLQSSTETQRWPQRDAVLGIPEEQDEDGSSFSGTVPLAVRLAARAWESSCTKTVPKSTGPYIKTPKA